MHPAYFPVLWWSLFIFASFLGYGELLRRVLNRREFDDLGWGLVILLSFHDSPDSLRQVSFMHPCEADASRVLL